MNPAVAMFDVASIAAMKWTDPMRQKGQSLGGGIGCRKIALN
jgi:hypothetical protein